MGTDITVGFAEKSEKPQTAECTEVEFGRAIRDECDRQMALLTTPMELYADKMTSWSGVDDKVYTRELLPSYNTTISDLLRRSGKDGLNYLTFAALSAAIIAVGAALFVAAPTLGPAFMLLCVMILLYVYFSLDWSSEVNATIKRTSPTQFYLNESRKMIGGTGRFVDTVVFGEKGLSFLIYGDEPVYEPYEAVTGIWGDPTYPHVYIKFASDSRTLVLRKHHTLMDTRRTENMQELIDVLVSRVSAYRTASELRDVTTEAKIPAGDADNG